MTTSHFAKAIGTGLLLGSGAIAYGYPVVDDSVGLSKPALVAIFPDEADKNKYYFLPTSVELVRDTSEEPNFGVQHWGFSRTDPDGMGAALTFSVRPAYDAGMLKAVQEEVEKKRNGGAPLTWAAVPLLCSRMEVIINGSFAPESQTMTKEATSTGYQRRAAGMRLVVLATDSPAGAGAADSGVATNPSGGDPADTADGENLTPQLPKPAPLCSKEKYKDPQSPIASLGGSVDATQAFSIKLANLGARAFSQGVAEDSAVLGARFTYVFRGVGKRLHARITVNTSRFYNHFKNGGKGSAWWGLGKVSWSQELRDLKKSGAIKLDILEGGESEDKASAEYMQEIMKQLVSASIRGEGMFKPELTPVGLPGTPETSNSGWGFSGSHNWERMKEKNSFVFEINRRSLEEREYSVGLSFASVCARYPTHFVDLSTKNKQCIDPNRYQAVVRAVQSCVRNKRVQLKKDLDEGIISKKTWERESDEAGQKPCYTTTTAPQKKTGA